MDLLLKEKLQKIVENTKNNDICIEKPSFASVVFAYMSIKDAMSEYLYRNVVSFENTENFLTEIAPVSRLNYSLMYLGIIDKYEEDYPFWINYVGDLVAEELIEDAKVEIENRKNMGFDKHN